MWTSPASDRPPRFAPIAGPSYVAEILPRPDLDATGRASMLAVLAEYFEGVSRERFEADLDEKDWVILLKDRATGSLAGFTTLMRFACPSEPEVVALFSGDTIVRHEAWNELLLPRAWAKLAFALASREERDVYWFLICSGFRTYRFLPVFFREFYPRHDTITPAREREIADRLAAAKFGDQYDPSAGVVKPAWPAPLRGCDDTGTRQDPHVSFFRGANPGHVAGDELVCLARLAPDNLTAAGRRMSRSA